MQKILANFSLAEQTKLKSIMSILNFASDLSHAQISIYLNLPSEKALVVLAQAKPETAFVYYRKENIGKNIAYIDEPLIFHAFNVGSAVQGKREWASGMFTNMYLHPLTLDNHIFAVVALEFVDSLQCYPSQGLFMKIAIELLENPEQLDVNLIKERLSTRDGMIVVNKEGLIIGLNNIIQNIYLTLGVSKIISRRITDRKLFLDGLISAYKSNLATAYELKKDNQIFAQRLIPLTKNKLLKFAIIIMVDITELKKRDTQLLVKSAVIQEIHHRVKNNLQTIASLLRIQARRTDSPETKLALKESINRILSISVVHEFLSQQDQDLIDVQIVGRNIFELIIKNMLDPAIQITTKFYGNTIILPSEQANSIALVINELTQNAVEHAFIGREQGFISLSIYITPKSYCIEIQDDGTGLPQNFCLEQTGSLGLQIVKTLVESDLGGKFSLMNNLGTLARIVIPKNKEA